MNQVLNLNFMEPLKSVLSGGWSVMVTWLSEWNRVEALAADIPLAAQDACSSPPGRGLHPPSLEL